jgi:transposase InsO family protein
MQTTSSRLSWDTSVKHCYRLGLETALPETLRKEVPRTNQHRWKYEADNKYLGCKLNEIAKQNYDELVTYANDKNWRKISRGYFRIVKIFQEVVLTVKGVQAALYEAKEVVIEAIDRVREMIPVKKAVRVFGFHQSTYQRWVLELKVACDGSYFEWCNRSLPFQLSKPEVFKIKEMLTAERFQYWGIYNIAKYALRNNILPLSITTWYKYAKLLGIHRPRPHHRRKKRKKGVRASQPNEIWHMDVSLFKIGHMTYYIYVVMDNFSRKVLTWEVSSKLSKNIRLRTIKNAYTQALELGKEINCALWVDGGSENNNTVVDQFIEQSQIGIHKVIALRDTTLSNSMVESIFKTMKYGYLYRMKITNMTDLRRSLRMCFEDYNEQRPHYALDGGTPNEVYNGEVLNRQDHALYLSQAKIQRRAYNKENECGKCLTIVK